MFKTQLYSGHANARSVCGAGASSYSWRRSITVSSGCYLCFVLMCFQLLLTECNFVTAGVNSVQMTTVAMANVMARGQCSNDNSVGHFHPQ